MECFFCVEKRPTTLSASSAMLFMTTFVAFLFEWHLSITLLSVEKKSNFIRLNYAIQRPTASPICLYSGIASPDEVNLKSAPKQTNLILGLGFSLQDNSLVNSNGWVVIASSHLVFLYFKYNFDDNIVKISIDFFYK